ncbi:related to PKR1 [Lecanosticta acicola]|uniref:Related to PKR1 n=1 Tax=Lecanosticta acicola TaxID=111012 RepID=A0AAI9E9C6_9PEZI|nr:related to PKR1 [Lecanosticta acicola]
MGDFLSNLWESVFEAGPTPTLLVATNVTFGALQFLLAGLLIATYSIHFAILSLLCGGLWYSINWFAAEIQAAQAKEAEAERLRRRKSDRSPGKGGDGGVDADDEGEDTEVEGGMRDSTASLELGGASEDERVKKEIQDAMKMPPPNVAATGKTYAAATGSQAKAGAIDSRHRRQGDGDKSASEISTDSEWEKVEDGR